MHLQRRVLAELSMQALGTVGAMCCRSRRLEKLLMLQEPGTREAIHAARTCREEHTGTREAPPPAPFIDTWYCASWQSRSI